MYCRFNAQGPPNIALGGATLVHNKQFRVQQVVVKFLQLTTFDSLNLDIIANYKILSDAS